MCCAPRRRFDVCRVSLVQRDGLVRMLPSGVAFGFDAWVSMHRDPGHLRLMLDHPVRHLRTHIASEAR